jgi:hypothetical protein
MHSEASVMREHFSDSIKNEVSALLSRCGVIVADVEITRGETIIAITNATKGEK